MKYASVCSGIEAATVAWRPLGWEPAWFSEIEPFPSAVLAHHYPDTPNLGDMTAIGGQDLEPGRFDLLVGGTPCQSFSVAGLRKGLADPRGNLALHFLKLIDAARPRWVVWENVPGVLSSNGGRDFGAFLGGLGQLGYGWGYRTLDAQHFGLAQRRRRVFVVGHLGDWRRAAAVLFERASLCGHPAPSRAAGAGVAALTANGVGTCGADDNQAQAGHLVLAHDQGGAEVLEDQAPTLSCNHEAPIAFDTTQITNDKNYSNPKPGDPSHPLAVAFEPCMVRTTGGQPQDELAHCLRSSYSATDTAPCVAHNTAVRRLTPRECERLQGFPDDYTRIPYRNKAADQCPDGPRYKALGNSMAVPCMRWIGERIGLVDNLEIDET